MNYCLEITIKNITDTLSQIKDYISTFKSDIKKLLSKDLIKFLPFTIMDFQIDCSALETEWATIQGIPTNNGASKRLAKIEYQGTFLANQTVYELQYLSSTRLNFFSGVTFENQITGTFTIDNQIFSAFGVFEYVGNGSNKVLVFTPTTEMLEYINIGSILFYSLNINDGSCVDDGSECKNSNSNETSCSSNNCCAFSYCNGDCEYCSVCNGFGESCPGG
jgi:hypothetical protein